MLLLAVAVLAGIVSFIERRHAQAQSLTSDAELLGAQAQTEPNLDRALLLAVAGVKLQNRVQTRSDLLAALQRSPALIRVARPSRSKIVALQVSPDGKLLAVADSAGVVRFIDLASWRPLGAAVQLAGTVAPQAMSFAPDGRTLAVITEGAARSELDWISVSTHRVRHIQAWHGVVPPPPTRTSSVAYSPDGRHIAVSLITYFPSAATPSAERLVMLDASSGRTLWQRRYPMRPGQLEPHVAFTPSGVLLTSAPQGDTLLWSTRSGRILRRFPIGGLPAVSEDGARVALGRNSKSLATPSASVAVLNLRTGKHRRLADDLPGEWIESMAFAPGGSKIIAGALGGIHVWDVRSGAIAETYTGQPGRRAVMTLDPRRGNVISGAQDGSIAVFNESGARPTGPRVPLEHAGTELPRGALHCRQPPVDGDGHRSGGWHDRARRPANAAVDADAARARRRHRQRDRVRSRRPHAGRRRHQRSRHLLGPEHRPGHPYAAVPGPRVVDRRQPRRQAARGSDPSREQC